MELEDKHDDSMEPIAASQPSQVSSGDAPLAKRPAIADIVSPVGSAGRVSPSTGARALTDAPERLDLASTPPTAARFSIASLSPHRAGPASTSSRSRREESRRGPDGRTETEERLALKVAELQRSLKLSQDQVAHFLAKQRETDQARREAESAWEHEYAHR